MGKEILTFVDNEIEKKKVFPGQKNYNYFVGYIIDYEIKPFNIFLSKIECTCKNL